MRLRRQQSEPRRRWADLALAEVQEAARSSPAGGLAADMQAEVQALAAERDGQLPPWLRYVDDEQEQ